MLATLDEFTLCPNCGSTEYLEDYPSLEIASCSKCNHEVIKIKLRMMTIEDILNQNCPHCGKEGDEDEPFVEVNLNNLNCDEINEDYLFLNDEDRVLVYKCKKCGELDGYRVINKPAKKRVNKPKPLALYKIESDRPVYSAQEARELAKEIRKTERAPKYKCKKELDYLICHKIYLLQQNGLSREIIRRSAMKARSYIYSNGPFTKKQVEIIFCAVTLLITENLTTLDEFNRKRLTERQMERIFDVDRKTMRKWKEILRKQDQNMQPKTRLLIRANFGHETSDLEVEIPQDLVAATKLNNPTKGKCSYCNKSRLLTWQLKFSNASWTNICQESFEALKKLSIQEKWKQSFPA